MKRFFILLVLALALAGAGLVTLYQFPIGASENIAYKRGNAEKGAYLARMAGCIACHTDVEGGGAPLAGGVKLQTGFGTFYSPNLTTDKKNGIGAWSPNDFAKAVRQGVSPDGKPYYPAFPYTFYSKLTDQDIADLWAAFKTVPPNPTQSKEQDMMFPFSFRPGLKLWRTLFLDTSPFAPVKNKSTAWNRGKYIVEGPAHCAACHTPRNLLGARDVEQKLHGTDGLPNGGKSSPITSEQLKKKGWTASTLKYALKTGVLPDGDAFGGSMGEVVRDGTSFLTDEDLTAIAAYLLEKE
jgi:mono/diheme cytochrome c family protein